MSTAAPEPDEAEFAPLPECGSDCYDYEEHVAGCPHGPDWELPSDWTPDYGAETPRERQLAEYAEKYR